MQGKDPEVQLQQVVAQPAPLAKTAGSAPVTSREIVLAHPDTPPAPEVDKIKRTFRRIELRSLSRVASVFSASMAAAWVVAALILFSIAKTAGIVDNLQNLMRQIGWPQFQMTAWTVIRGAFLSGLALAVVATGLTVLSAFMYNLISDLVGGVEVNITDEKTR